MEGVKTVIIDKNVLESRDESKLVALSRNVRTIRNLM